MLMIYEEQKELFILSYLIFLPNQRGSQGWRGRVFVLGLLGSCIGWRVGGRSTGALRAGEGHCLCPAAFPSLQPSCSLLHPVTLCGLLLPYLTFLIHCTSCCLPFALTFFSPSPFCISPSHHPHDTPHMHQSRECCGTIHLSWTNSGSEEQTPQLIIS